MLFDPTFNIISSFLQGGQASAKFERVTYIMTLQILLECGRSNPFKTVAGLAERGLFQSVFRSPKANDPEDIWDLQLKCLTTFTPAMKILSENWDTEILVNRLLSFGKSVLEKARVNDNLEKEPEKPNRKFGYLFM